MTQAGIQDNFEQITVSRSWVDPTQAYITEKLAFQFGRLWDDKEDGCKVIAAPEALKKGILQAYRGEAPTEGELRALYERATKSPDTPGSIEQSTDGLPQAEFAIPSGLRYDDGPFAHQGQAVQAWCDAGFRGVLEMATGSGKTITAMIAAYRVFETHHPLLIVVAAPYVPLIQQWCDEIAPFGLKPINLTTVSGAQGRAKALGQVRRRLRLGLSKVEVSISVEI
jgi:Rad3-related DNA helicase